MNTRERHRLDRHKVRVEELKLWRNARESRIEEWRFAADGKEEKEIGLGDFWPEEALPASFSAEAKIPEGWAGSPVELELWLGGEGFEQLGDHEIVPHLLDVVDAAFAGLFPLWPSGSEVALTRYLESYAESTDGGPWSLPPAPRSVEPLSEETRGAVREARDMVAASLKGLKAEYPPIGRIALTGHAHLDLAWLWPVSETIRKGRRTFASVLSLMERYDDLVFNQSSAQLYRWIETGSQEIFEGVKRRVEGGRWEPVGGSWVEADCQIPSGESMARQMLYGQRYFEEKFGHRSRVAWLPDAFGFSPALPQLLRGAGMEGFFTYKLNWSETNEFPYDLYEWEGIDGSTVIAHDFENPGQDYNGNITPQDIYGTWRNFQGKRHHPESLFSFGWGDGGGGPSEQMLENYARLKSFPAMPRLRMAHVDGFFESLPREGLPRWTGELYLELHRGTLTTPARVKKLNREAEHRLLEAEALSTLAALHGGDYQREELETAWKALLLNQFHDILPGTSIGEVYEETHEELADVVRTARKLRDRALSPPPDAESALLVANVSLNPRPLSVLLDPESRPLGAAHIAGADGRPLPAQETEGGGLLVHAPNISVSGLGWLSLTAQPESAPARHQTREVSAEAAGGRAVLDNGLLRVEIGEDGTLHGVYDREAGREVLDGRANQLWAYTDKPRNWEAWDVDEGYEQEGEEISGVESVEVVE